MIRLRTQSVQRVGDHLRLLAPGTYSTLGTFRFFLNLSATNFMRFFCIEKFPSMRIALSIVGPEQLIPKVVNVDRKKNIRCSNIYQFFRIFNIRNFFLFLLNYNFFRFSRFFKVFLISENCVKFENFLFFYFFTYYQLVGIS